MNWHLGTSHLDDLGNWEEESVRVSPVDCRQLGREEDEANNEDLTNCEEWEAGDRIMGSIKTCRPIRNLSMLSPLAAIWPSLSIV